MSSKINSLLLRRLAAGMAAIDQREAQNLAVLTGGEALSRAITAVAFIHLARVLRPETYGLVELTLAIIMMLTVLIDLGFASLGAREVARTPEQTESLVRRIVAIQGWLAVGILVALYIFISVANLEYTLKYLLLGYGVSLLAYPFFLNWVFQGRKQMLWVTLPKVLRQFAFAAVAILVVRRPEHVLLLPLAEIIASGAAGLLNVAIYIRSGSRFTIAPRAAADRRLILESLPIGGSMLIWAIRMYLPAILLGILVSQTAVGFFGAPHRIVLVLHAALVVYFTNLFPTMSKAAHVAQQHLVTLIHQSLRLVIWPTIFVSVGVTFFAPVIIDTIFGAPYMRGESIIVLMVLIWAIPVLAWRGHSRNGLIAINRQREELICSLASVILLVVLLVTLPRAYGAVGAAWAMLISETIAAALSWWLLKRYLPELQLTRLLLRPPSLAVLTNHPEVM